MSCKPPRRIAAAVFLLGILCCSRAPKPQIERIAVLRFENLSGDPSLDWAGRALSEILTAELAGSPRTYAIPISVLHGFDAVLGRQPSSAPGIAAEREQALLAGANRIIYGRYSSAGSGVRIDVAVEDPATLRTVRTGTATGPVMAAAGSLARELAPQARPFGTANEAAIRAYAAAVEAPDAAHMHEDLRQAVAADPNFGEAWTALLDLTMTGARDRAAADQVLSEARAHAERFTAAARARLELSAATLEGDPPARERALAGMVRFYPADPVLHRHLAEIAMARRDYRNAVAEYRTAVMIEPDDVAQLNALGYAEAYAGDLPSATEALRRYERLRPNEANPLDSLGDVYLYLGHLSEAEQFYTKSFEKDANFNGGGSGLKAAWARLMAGDVAGATQLFERYIRARQAAGDTVIPWRRAEWAWMSGRRREALGQIEGFARASEGGKQPGIASRAYAEAALWALLVGDSTNARDLAAKAVASAGPASTGVASVVRFLTEPAASSSEWAVRAEREFPNASAAIKNFAVGYALLLSKQFQAAVPVFKEINAQPNAESGAPVLLAWTYAATGHYREALPLLQVNPIPQPTGLAPFHCFWFPRIFAVRAQVLKNLGQADAAQRNERIYRLLSGEAG